MLKSFVPVAYEEVLSFFIGKKFVLDREVSLVTSSVLTMLIPTSDRPSSDRPSSSRVEKIDQPSSYEDLLPSSASSRVEKIEQPSSSDDLLPSYRTRPKFGSSRVKKIDQPSSSEDLSLYQTRTKFKPSSCRRRSKFGNILRFVTILITLFCFIVLSQTGKMGKFGRSHADTFESGEPKDFKAPTKLIPNVFFYYGENMQRKYVKLYRNIMNYIGKHYGGSVLKSIKRDEITVVDIPEPLDYMEAQYKALTQRMRKKWEAQITSYNNRELAISAKVQDAYHLVWAHCHVSLQTQIVLDAEFMAMAAEQEC